MCSKRAQTSAWLQPLALERFFDVVDPRLRVLEALPYQLYAAKVVEERLAVQVREGGAVSRLALLAVDERVAWRAPRARLRGPRPCHGRG